MYLPPCLMNIVGIVIVYSGFIIETIRKIHYYYKKADSKCLKLA